MTVCPLIYLLDTSGSMSGSRIEKLNRIMKKTLDDLSMLNVEEEYVIKASILSFATSCKWITSGLMNIKEIQWKNLEAEGITSFGEAFKELAEKLCRDELLKFENNQRILRPIIILFTDGQPTDSYKPGLMQLKRNVWFSHASLKFAVGLDDNDTDGQILVEFVENQKCVILADDMDIICQMINNISLASVQYNIEHSTKNLLRSPVADAEDIITILESDNNDGLD